MDYPSTNATVETLPNGLTLILDPDAFAPVVSTQIWVETGSIHEDRLLGSGVSHFLEHMVFKGTRDFGADELAETVQAAGGHWNAYTSFDRTVYFIDGPAQSLPVFLRCLTGLVFFPTLPESEFDREKDVIRREIDMGQDDPDHASTQLLLSNVFQNDPRCHPVIGHRHLFDALTYADLTATHRNRYTTERCFVVISGDFDPVEARKEILALTADCHVGGGREPLVAQDPPQMGPRRSRATFAIPVSRVCIAWHCPPIDHPDTPAYSVLSALLGHGRASRLYRRLRDERGLALEISAFAWNMPSRDGIFALSAIVTPEKRDELIDAMFAEISALSTGNLEEELAKAKRQIATIQFRNLTSASGRAADLASNWLHARDLDYTRRCLAGIWQVTADDIRRIAASLTEEFSTLTVLDPLDAPAPIKVARARSGRAEMVLHQLSNGLNVAVIPDRRVPLIHLQAAIMAGLPSESATTNGLNQLLASTLTKGTQHRNGWEIAKTLESLGASIGCDPGNNSLMVRADGLACDFETILEVFHEVLSVPNFPEEAIVREKSSQLAVLEEALQDPMHAGFLALRRAMFGDGGYGLDSLGTPESLDSLTRQHLIDHHARHFTAANMVISVIGDLDPESVLDAISQKFPSLPRGEAVDAQSPYSTDPDHPLVRLPKKQAVLAIGFPGSSFSDPTRYALTMLLDYASDMSGPLFTRVREELGLAYQVGATQFLGRQPGMFTYYVSTSPEQIDQAREEMLAEIAKIADSGIPDAAFDRVRSSVISSLVIQQQSPTFVAKSVALNILYGIPADDYLRQVEIYRELTPEHVREVAAKIFSTPPIIATVLPNDHPASE